jgi:predicted RNase H-like HicB family nuclease
MSVRYAVIFEQAERNGAAYVPDLPGCITAGCVLEETERNIREAIEGHLKTMREFGDPIPQPTSVARDIEIQPAA